MSRIDLQFRDSLERTLKSMRDTNDDGTVKIINEWEEESKELYNILEKSHKYLRSKLFCDTLEYHNFNLKTQLDYLESNDEQVYEDTLDNLSDYIFRVQEDIESIIPKVEQEILEK